MMFVQKILVQKHIRLLSVRVDLLTEKEFEYMILRAIEEKRRGWICYVNVHTLQYAQEMKWYKEFIDNAYVAYCDGEGIRLGARILGYRIPQRITLTTYIFKLAEIALRENLSLFFLGAQEVVLTKAIDELKKRYPSLRIVGWYHGYFAEEEEENIVKEINVSKPDILLIGIGGLKQEQWVLKYFQKVQVPLLWVGGGFLDTLSGEKFICPRWLAKIGFEWLFRLLQEPRRLWKRYLWGNPKFLYDILQEKVKILFLNGKQR